MEFSAGKNVSVSVVKTHSIAVLIVCVLFGFISFVRGEYSGGIFTVLAGIIIPIISMVFMKNSQVTTRGIFLTQSVTVVIAVLSAAQGELHSMFALLAGNIAIGSVYYNLKNIKITWILTDVILIAALFIKDVVYVGVGIALLIKGILGLNIAALMVMFLLKSCLKSIDDAEKASAHAESLLLEVQEKMAETQRLSEEQLEMVEHIRQSSQNLNSSAESMLDISSQLASSSEEQSSTISDINSGIEHLSDDAKNNYIEAENTSKAINENSLMLNENHKNMNKLVDAMEYLNTTSHKIGGIIKTIEDIAFQTNILALNAAVEAARAGSAGKGFAVVADEVRNLANKSSEAANNTANLINESISAVEQCTKFVKTTSEQMDGMLKFSAITESHANQIRNLTEKQQREIEDIKNRMLYVSEIISVNTETSSESTAIAQGLFDEVERMNTIISKN